MAKRRGRKSIQRDRYRQYQKVAEHFFVAAGDSIDLGYWTAAGVLIVHSAIAYVDALCIQQSGQRSSGGNHDDAITLLDEAISDGEEKTSAMNQLRRIIEEKTKVSYLGDLYTARQSEELWKRLKRFREWAERILNR